jgi:hypothetical protein
MNRFQGRYLCSEDLDATDMKSLSRAVPRRTAAYLELVQDLGIAKRAKHKHATHASRRVTLTLQARAIIPQKWRKRKDVHGARLFVTPPT